MSNIWFFMHKSRPYNNLSVQAGVLMESEQYHEEFLSENIHNRNYYIKSLPQAQPKGKVSL